MNFLDRLTQLKALKVFLNPHDRLIFKGLVVCVPFFAFTFCRLIETIR
jgi:hypothetical protein